MAVCTESNELTIGLWHFYADGTLMGPGTARVALPELAHAVRDGAHEYADELWRGFTHQYSPSRRSD